MGIGFSIANGGEFNSTTPVCVGSDCTMPEFKRKCMALFGSCAFGIVMGWLAVLIHHPAIASSEKLVWQRVAILLFGWVSASALVWFYLGFQGVFLAGLGMALGVIVALALKKSAHHA